MCLKKKYKKLKLLRWYIKFFGLSSLIGQKLNIGISKCLFQLEGLSAVHNFISILLDFSNPHWCLGYKAFFLVHKLLFPESATLKHNNAQVFLSSSSSCFYLLFVNAFEINLTDLVSYLNGLILFSTDSFLSLKITWQD